MITKHLFKRGTAVIGALLAMSAAVYAADPSTFPAPTGYPFRTRGCETRTRVRRRLCVDRGRLGGSRRHDLFQRYHFHQVCKDPSGKYLQAGNIWKHNPKTGETTIFRSPSGMSNGIKFDREGNMIAALGADYGGQMLVKTDMKTGKSYILTGLYDGKPYNALNDVTIDEKGRIYFSDPRYLGHEPIFQDGYAVYRLDTDGTVTRAATDCGKCNGVLISPDQKTLYIIGNDNGWFEFQNLKEGEKTLQGHHQLPGCDVGGRRRA